VHVERLYLPVMTRFLGFLLVLVSTAILAAPAATGGPITKQNGSTPVLTNFTSICTIPFYVGYGYCGGNPQALTEISGRINAVQPKSGVWNLDISFGNLQPGAKYMLHGNQNPAIPVPGVVVGFFPIATGVAGLDGKLQFKCQTTNPACLGFDLNRLADEFDSNGTTVVTSYWSKQRLQVSSDGTLVVSGS
jgi:hypothetical protein